MIEFIKNTETVSESEKSLMEMIVRLQSDEDVQFFLHYEAPDFIQPPKITRKRGRPAGF